MNTIVCFEPFIGALSAKNISSVAESVFSRAGEVCFSPLPFPEGFLSFYAEKCGGKILPVQYTDANLFKKSGAYGVAGDTGFLSMGDLLPIPDTMIKDPLCGTGFGVGEVVKTLLALKKKKIVIALSDACCFDMGLGFLAALGGKFFDTEDKEFLPSGGTLTEIKRFDLSDPMRLLAGVEIELIVDKCRSLSEALSDARSFGARTSDIPVLENNIKTLVTQTDVFNHHPDFPGAGEGGGLCYALTALFNASVHPFSDLVLPEIKKEIDRSDLVLTGEGGFFPSSFGSATVTEIIRYAEEKRKDVLALSDTEKYNFGRALYPADLPRRQCRSDAESLLYTTLTDYFRK